MTNESNLQVSEAGPNCSPSPLRRKGFFPSKNVIQIFMIVALSSPFAQASRQFQSLSDKLLGGSMTLPPSGTVSLMVNPHFTASDGLYHIFFEVMQPVDHGFQILAGPGTIFADWNNGVFNWTSVPNPLPANTWANIVVTWVNGGATTLYIDGSPVASRPGTAWLDTAGYTWSFGNRSVGGYDAHSDLAQFGVWNRVLTSSEISSLGIWALPSTIASGLIAEYDFAGSSLAPQTGGVGTLVASGPIAAPDLPPPPSPSLSLNGPSRGTAGVPSYFSMGESHLANTTVVTLSDAGAGGTFSSTSVTLTGGNPFATFTYTPVSNGNIAISATNDQGIANPAPINLQVIAIQPPPTLSVDSTTKSVRRGTDATYVITQTIPNGYTGDPPALRIFNVPAGFTFSVNGVDCGSSRAAISFFNWSNCGVSPGGTYTLTVHTGSLAAGAYFFGVMESEPQFPNGSGLTLGLTVN